MNNVIKNKLLTGLVVFLLLANAGTILLFWINRPEKRQAQMGSPRDFLVHELELDSSQLGEYSLLIEKHQSAARDLKMDIKSAKEELFQLLKQPVIAEAQKKKTIEAITTKIKELELLNLEHFQQVRAVCNEKQKKKFDGLLDQLAGLMAESRPPRAGIQTPPNVDGHHPSSANDSVHSSSPNTDKRRLLPPNEDGHHPPPPRGEGHRPPPPNGDGHHPPPPSGEGHRPPPPPKADGNHPPPPPPDQY